VLCGVSPLVWRRLFVVSKTSLVSLNLKTAIAWNRSILLPQTTA